MSDSSVALGPISRDRIKNFMQLSYIQLWILALQSLRSAIAVTIYTASVAIYTI